MQRHYLSPLKVAGVLFWVGFALVATADAFFDRLCSLIVEGNVVAKFAVAQRGARWPVRPSAVSLHFPEAVC